MSQPVEIRDNISKPVINTIVTGTVEAIEHFKGEKMSGYSLYFIDNTNDSETIYTVKITNLDELTAKSYLHKNVKIEQCKPLNKTSYITEEKPTLLQKTAQKD